METWEPASLGDVVGDAEDKEGLITSVVLWPQNTYQDMHLLLVIHMLIYNINTFLQIDKIKETREMGQLLAASIALSVYSNHIRRLITSKDIHTWVACTHSDS